MNPGDFVRYYFARKYPVIGIVLRKWEYEGSNDVSTHGTYVYSVEIMENNGVVGVFDIHVGDEWEILSENR